ncbi:MAG: alpha/beta fold hydrolase [Egibacteraceae bacterium]
MRTAEVWARSRQTDVRMLAYDGAGPGGRAVVVLHGLGAGIDVLREVVPGFDPYRRLAEQGLNVLALDWPGHGRSGGRRGHLTYRLAMEAAATGIEQAHTRWNGPVALLGSALGGVLAFYVALEEPGTVSAVVCHDVLDLRDVRPLLRRGRQQMLLPALAWLQRRVGLEGLSGLALPAAAVVAWTDQAGDPELVARLRAHPQAVRRYDIASLASLLLTPEEKPAIRAQKVPTLVAVGSRDRILGETDARAFASQLACEHKVWVLPGGGHQLLLEHPSAFLPEVADFVMAHTA